MFQDVVMRIVFIQAIRSVRAIPRHLMNSMNKILVVPVPTMTILPSALISNNRVDLSSSIYFQIARIGENSCVVKIAIRNTINVNRNRLCSPENSYSLLQYNYVFLLPLSTFTIAFNN